MDAIEQLKQDVREGRVDLESFIVGVNSPRMAALAERGSVDAWEFIEVSFRDDEKRWRRYPLGIGRISSSTDAIGVGSFIFLSMSLKQLRPACIHRVISAVTLASVKVFKYTRNDSNTLVMIVCRRAPAVVLLVRPVSRA